jgi:hypothetical protein
MDRREDVMQRFASVVGILGGLAWISLAYIPPACVPVTDASEVFCNRLWTPPLVAMLVGSIGLCGRLRPSVGRSIRASLLALAIGFAMMAVGNGVEYWIAFDLPHQGGSGLPVRSLLWMTALAGWLTVLVASFVSGLSLQRDAQGRGWPSSTTRLFFLPLPLTVAAAALGPAYVAAVIGLVGIIVGVDGLVPGVPSRPSKTTARR